MEDKLTIYQSHFLKALSNPVRLKLIKKLLSDEKCQCEIIKEFNKAQSTISQHLGILVKTGILESRPEGQKIFYRVRNNKILHIIDLSREIIEQNI